MSDDPYCLFKIFAQKHASWFTNEGMAALNLYNLKKMGKVVTALLVCFGAHCSCHLCYLTFLLTLFQADTSGPNNKEFVTFCTEFISGIVLALDHGTGPDQHKVIVGSNWTWIRDFRRKVHLPLYCFHLCLLTFHLT